MRRVENLPAQSGKEQVQGVRGWGHLQARSDQEQVQGVRRGRHLPTQSGQEPVQNVRSRQGRFDAAGSRGARLEEHPSKPSFLDC